MVRVQGQLGWGAKTCGAGCFLWSLRKITVGIARAVPSLFLLATNSGKKTNLKN